MSTTKAVAANTGVQIVGRFFSALLAIFTLSLVLRAFGEELQGRYLLAMAYAQFASTVADFGLGTYLVRAIAGGLSQSSQGLIFRLITALPFYLLFFAVSFLLPYDVATRQAIWVALISGFLISLNNTLVVYYQAKLQMHIPVTSEVINKILVFALTALVIALGWPFLWAVAVVVAGALANFLLNYWIGRRDLPYRAKADFGQWGEIVQETWPLWVVGVLILIYFRIDTLMLSALPLPAGQNNLVEVGYYSTAYKFLEMLIAVPMMFYGAVLPVLVKARGDSAQLLSIIRRSLSAITIFALPVTVLVYLAADPLIALFFPGYLPAAAALKILIWAFLFSALSTGFYFAVIGLGAQKRLVMPYILVSVLNILVNLWLIPRYGFYGAAYATVITEAIIVFITYRLAKKVVGFDSLVSLFRRSNV